jgi:hypothetical protein
VAKVPEETFEALVESDDPPTATSLTTMGTVRPLIDLKGRDPKDFAASTHAQGMLRRMEELCREVPPTQAVARAFPRGRRAVLTRLGPIGVWLRELHRLLKREVRHDAAH